MSEPDKEPVAQGLNYILSALDIVAEMALSEEHYDEVAAEQVRLSQVISRAQLILSFIDARKAPKKHWRAH
jgi:hypothetical protein